MKVISIQTNQVVHAFSRSPDYNDPRVDAGKGLAPESTASALPSSSASASAAQPAENQARALVSRIDYIRNQLDRLLADFPPFFPAGSYQRNDLIKGIRGIQDEVEKSADQITMKKGISSGKLNENATDSDIAAALDGLFDLREQLSQSFPTAALNPPPGILVSIKV